MRSRRNADPSMSPSGVVRGAVQRPGTCESLELRICALTGQGNRVSVETTLKGIREGVFSCRPRQECDREAVPAQDMVSKIPHRPTIASRGLAPLPRGNRDKPLVIRLGRAFQRIDQLHCHHRT